MFAEMCVLLRNSLLALRVYQCHLGDKLKAVGKFKINPLAKRGRGKLSLSQVHRQPIILSPFANFEVPEGVFFVDSVEK